MDKNGSSTVKSSCYNNRNIDFWSERDGYRWEWDGYRWCHNSADDLRGLYVDPRVFITLNVGPYLSENNIYF